MTCVGRSQKKKHDGFRVLPTQTVVKTHPSIDKTPDGFHKPTQPTRAVVKSPKGDREVVRVPSPMSVPTREDAHSMHVDRVLLVARSSCLRL